VTASLYTASRLKVWRDCHRKAFFRYTLMIRTPSTPAMEFGTNVHTALEHWYRAWQAGDLEGRLPVAFKAIDAMDVSPVERIKLRAVVAAYHARWSGEPWDVLAVEVEFRYFLGDVEVGGKIDAIIRHRVTGEVFVVEHKTTRTDTSPGSPYWERLTIDTQVSIYIDGAMMLGHQVAGCIYDVLKRPAHEQLAASPLEKYNPALGIGITKGVGCKDCGGSGKPGAIAQGRGYTIVNFVEVQHVPCAECSGTGWRNDKDGKPRAPRPHADIRVEDETLDAFEERLIGAIADAPDDYLQRGMVVRLDDELPRMRQDLLDTVAEMQALEAAGLTPAPNPDGCAKGRDLCAFFDVCAGRDSIDNTQRFPRDVTAHPELATVAA
jgi:hypothetical protein